MVGDEADRADDDRAGAGRREAADHVEHVRPEPRVRRAAGALPRHLPGHARVPLPLVGQPGPVDDELGRTGELLGIRVAGRDDPLGQRVGGEDDRPVTAGRRQRREGGEHPVGQQVGETGGVEPLADRDERDVGSEPADLRRRPVEVLPGTEARTVGGEDEPDDAVDPPADEAGCGLLDRRIRVLRAVADVEPTRPVLVQPGGDPRHLGGRAGGQRRRPADGVVAPAQIGQLLGRRRPAAADPRVERLDLLRRRRRAVGHDEHTHLLLVDPFLSARRRYRHRAPPVTRPARRRRPGPRRGRGRRRPRGCRGPSPAARRDRG